MVIKLVPLVESLQRIGCSSCVLWLARLEIALNTHVSDQPADTTEQLYSTQVADQLCAVFVRVWQQKAENEPSRTQRWLLPKTAAFRRALSGPETILLEALADNVVLEDGLDCSDDSPSTRCHVDSPSMEYVDAPSTQLHFESFDLDPHETGTNGTPTIFMKGNAIIDSLGAFPMTGLVSIGRDLCSRHRSPARSATLTCSIRTRSSSIDLEAGQQIDKPVQNMDEEGVYDKGGSPS